MKPIGQRLKELREKTGKTQEEVSAILNITQGTLANYEKDRRVPGLDVIVQLAEIYHVPVDYILGTGVFEKWDLLLQNKGEVIKAISISAKRLSEDMLNGLDDISFARIAYAFSISIQEHADDGTIGITITDPIGTMASNPFPDNPSVDSDDERILSVYRDLPWEDKVLVCARAIELKRGISTTSGESEVAMENALPSNGTEGVA